MLTDMQVCAVALACNAGLTAPVNDEIHGPAGMITNFSYAQGALATYFLFNVIYGFTYTPLQGVIPAEALDTNMRAKGLAASGFIVGCVGFISQFCNPIANETMGYKYIYIFVGWDVFESVIWYFFWYVVIATFPLIIFPPLTCLQRRVPGPYPRGT